MMVICEYVFNCSIIFWLLFNSTCDHQRHPAGGVIVPGILFTKLPRELSWWWPSHMGFPSSIQVLFNSAYTELHPAQVWYEGYATGVPAIWQDLGEKTEWGTAVWAPRLLRSFTAELSCRHTILLHQSHPAFQNLCHSERQRRLVWFSAPFF